MKITDSNGQELRFGSYQYDNVIEFLKNHLKFIRDNIHDNFKFFRRPDDTLLIFVNPSDKSIQKIIEHMRKLNGDDEKMTISFDESVLKIVKK